MVKELDYTPEANDARQQLQQARRNAQARWLAETVGAETQAHMLHIAKNSNLKAGKYSKLANEQIAASSQQQLAQHLVNIEIVEAEIAAIDAHMGGLEKAAPGEVAVP